MPDGAAVGTKYCWVTSVRPPSASSGSTIWRHSAMHCIVVGKNPKVQVWGGDIRSGRGINTSISTVGGSTYGSWGEYGALSTRANSGFASGAGLSGGAASPVQSTWSRLTFANQSGTNNSVSPAVACTFGCYNLPALPLTLPTLAGQFTQGGNQLVLGSGPLSLNSQPIRDAANRPYTAYVGSDITLSDTTISAGRTMIVIASGTVTIQGNIVYEDASYSSISDIPQVVIRAPRINILGNTERVDAWLLAIGANGSGVLNTCADIPLTGNAGRLTAGLCDRQLTVNGPVLADTVHLRRTAGSDPSTRGEPAEIFNLRADAYLWGNAYSRRGANQVQTVYTKELAPRL